MQILSTHPAPAKSQKCRPALSRLNKPEDETAAKHHSSRRSQRSQNIELWTLISETNLHKKSFKDKSQNFQQNLE
jgi:hypothetical protein